LKVDGLDLDTIGGTPIYDLVPYFREMGSRGKVRESGWPGEMLKGYWDGS
jgi:tRNA (Thr-GGU) A37 N-methylase